MRRGARVVRSHAGGDIWAVNGPVNICESIGAMGERVLLAPPNVGGDWGLVGRAPDIEELHQTLERHGAGRPVPITGLGGLGKTALAAGYVASHGHLYELLAWLDATEPDLIPRQCKQMVRHRTGLDLPEKDAVEAARVLLANARTWLLVFDNASQPDDLQPYLPPGNGRILVTTRNETWATDRERACPLRKLSLEVVCGWLDRVLPDSDREAVRGIATHLDGLPLAIVQAIAYITARPGETAATYLTKLATKTGQRDLLSAKKPADYPRPVAATLQIAVDALHEERQEANELLTYLSYLAPEGIPVELIDGLLDVPDTPGLLEVLRRFGLIRASSMMVSLHRLVQDVIRWRLTDDEEGEHVNRWGIHLVSSAPECSDPVNADWFTKVAPHVLSLNRHTYRLRMYSPMLVAIGEVTGIALNSQRSYETSRVILEHNVAVTARASRDPDPTIRSTATAGLRAAIVHHLAQAYAGLWKHKEAAKHYRLAHALYQKDGQLEDAAMALNEFGFIERELGKPARAVELQEDALAIIEEASGPNSPEAALVLGNLATSYRQNNQPEQARRTYERALANFEGTYGSNHCDVAMVLLNFGGLCLEQGDIAKAFELRSRALKIFKKLLGPRHPDTAQAMYDLGNVHLMGGDDEKAQVLHQEALSVLTATRGSDDPKITMMRQLREIQKQAPRRPRGFVPIPLQPGSHIPRGIPEMLAQASKPRLRRNDPCWCGSGNKFKRCHGK